MSSWLMIWNKTIHVFKFDLTKEKNAHHNKFNGKAQKCFIYSCGFQSPLFPKTIKPIIFPIISILPKNKSVLFWKKQKTLSSLNIWAY